MRKIDRLKIAKALNQAAADEYTDTAWTICILFGVGVVGACVRWYYKRNKCINLLEKYLAEKGFTPTKLFELLYWFAGAACKPGEETSSNDLTDIFSRLIAAGCSVEETMAALRALGLLKGIPADVVKDIEDQIKNIKQIADEAAAAAAAVGLANWLLTRLVQTRSLCGGLCVDALELDAYLRARFPSLSPEDLIKISTLLLAILAAASVVGLVPEAAIVLASLKTQLATLLVTLGLVTGSAEADQMVEDLIVGTDDKNKCKPEIEQEFVGPPSPTDMTNQTDGPPPSGYFDGGNDVPTGVD